VPATAAGSPIGGRVVRVVDGDTVDVALPGGRRERVRLIGIDAPEPSSSECFARQATARARTLAEGKQVRLVADPSQDRRDRYRRLLAYVDLQSGDLGRRLLADGFARVYVYRTPFRRLAEYERAESAARAGGRGLWGACRSAGSSRSAPLAPPLPTEKCHPSYPGVCIPPGPDLDCADVSARAFPVRHDVPDPDPHGFDGDGDGVGCES
jgi:micrococcal nuclease